MARNPYPTHGHPFSRTELRKLMGVGKKFEWLDRFSRDTVFFEDEFLGDAINLDNWALANSGGAGAADFATNVQGPGVVRGATGTTDNGSISMIGPLQWYGDSNVNFEIRFKVDVVTSLHLEVGLIDGVPASNTGGVNDIDTPTFYAADGALVAYDTDQTATGLHFATVGSTTGQPDQATAFTSTVPGATAITLATFHTVRIALRTNDAFCWFDGKPVPHAFDAQGHVEGGVALAPWVYAQARNTTTKLVDVDYIKVWQDR